MTATARARLESRREARLSAPFVYRRCAGKCEVCGRWAGPILQYHHFVSVAHGGGGEVSNLIGLCPNCHALVTTLERKWNAKSDDDGVFIYFEGVAKRMGYPFEQTLMLLAIVSHDAYLHEAGVWAVKVRQ